MDGSAIELSKIPGLMGFPAPREFRRAEVSRPAQ